MFYIEGSFHRYYKLKALIAGKSQSWFAEKEIQHASTTEEIEVVLKMNSLKPIQTRAFKVSFGFSLFDCRCEQSC